MSQDRKTIELDQLLGKLNPDKIQEYFRENEDSLFLESNAFSAYMRDNFKKKGYSMQEVFLRADMPERYGYKIVAMEKHTVQRDVILRLCIASGFTLEETNRALKLYGVNELYSKVARDAVIIVALRNKVYNVDEINELLEKNHFEKLYSFKVE